jgi:L-amino acid N-acyltransferase YncA
MSACTFHEVTEAHLPELREIYNYYVRETTISFHMEEQSLSEMKQNVMHANPRYPAYVIQRDGIMQGYVLITQHKSKQAYDWTGEVTIYLHHEQLGRGIGRQALAFIESIARKLQYHVLVATICTENERSQRLFESSGYSLAAHFKEVGYKFGRRLDIASYQKILTD